MRPFACLPVLIIVATAVVNGQNDWKPTNLRHFPSDVPRAVLIQRMREFSFALGVRCQYCHAGDGNGPFVPSQYASDEKPAKAKARAMLKMVDDINQSLLAKIPARAEPRVVVDCATCHRGLPLPKSLQTTLFELVQREGSAAGVARYRELRRDQMGTGRYNFGQWEVNELARRLAEAGNVDAAIAFYDVNAEFYPESADIQYQVGELELARGNRDRALARYQAALRIHPDHAGAARRLKELDIK